MDRLRRWARKIRADLVILYLAVRSDQVPRYAKVIAVASIAYALSPIDLIPDFIPVLGYVDDLLIVPAGLALALRLIPDAVVAELRAAAAATNKLASRYGRWIAAGAVVLVWTALAVALFVLVR